MRIDELKDESIIEGEVVEEEETEEPDWQGDLADAMTLLEDVHDFLEIVIGENPTFRTPFYLKQLRRVADEISEFLDQYDLPTSKEKEEGVIE